MTVDSPADQLCADPGLTQFLINSKFLLHPCGDFRRQLEDSLRCSLFSFNLPPANEVSGASPCGSTPSLSAQEMQANSAAKEFVGAALVPDVIHHVFAGDARKVFGTGRTYRCDPSKPVVYLFLTVAQDAVR